MDFSPLISSPATEFERSTEVKGWSLQTPCFPHTIQSTFKVYLETDWKSYGHLKYHRDKALLEAILLPCSYSTINPVTQTKTLVLPESSLPFSSPPKQSCTESLPSRNCSTPSRLSLFSPTVVHVLIIYHVDFCRGLLMGLFEADTLKPLNSPPPTTNANPTLAFCSINCSKFFSAKAPSRLWHHHYDPLQPVPHPLLQPLLSPLLPHSGCSSLHKLFEAQYTHHTLPHIHHCW